MTLFPALRPGRQEPPSALVRTIRTFGHKHPVSASGSDPSRIAVVRWYFGALLASSSLASDASRLRLTIRLLSL